LKNYGNDYDNFLLVNLLEYNCNVAVAYGPPDNDKIEFIIDLEKLFVPSDTLLLEDFNIDLLTKHTPIHTNYVNTISCSGYEIINKITDEFPTRVHNNSATLIDHIITNKQDMECNVTLFTYNPPDIDRPPFDHKVITISCNITKPSINKLKSPLIKYVNKNNILKHLIEKPITLPQSNDTNILLNSLHKQLTYIIDKNTSYKKPKEQEFEQPWMTQQLMNLQKTKNLVDKLLLRYPTDIHLQQETTNLNTKITNLKRKLKKNYYQPTN